MVYRMKREALPLSTRRADYWRAAKVLLIYSKSLYLMMSKEKPQGKESFAGNFHLKGSKEEKKREALNRILEKMRTAIDVNAKKQLAIKLDVKHIIAEDIEQIDAQTQDELKLTIKKLEERKKSLEEGIFDASNREKYLLMSEVIK
ncbi:MAG: hypothetical protein GXP45_07400 [bacterium]|nr:hypothetical protein [bacterium]